MWMSYWHQINEVFKTGGKKLLVVGIGNKTVPNYLKTVSEYLEHRKFEVTTADIDENLNPDFICDVSELSECFDSESFDTILCAEVLEHLPFEKFERSLEELYKVSGKWVVLSLPYAGYGFRLSLELPNCGKKDFTLKIPQREKHIYDGWHRWEIGKKGYSREKVTEIIKKNYQIVRNYSPPENMNQLFFVLKKRNKKNLKPKDKKGTDSENNT
ncbi:hypothetical protein AKJ66_03035 [candidate division MSBL1 archaeon SCGC-AAA259E22]|uniref:Methyltransferase type 11 domain-containing protein n=1 Tax=candidate division MSBL1 archaeon SCGC-AAA259E22 TaxID=1698265 RepID=A0A133UFT8_9EURY|nr:hypothetical protein AKJ66_03035 [candidate division MSBL1 archaeon SCGC-AAA259E22]